MSTEHPLTDEQLDALVDELQDRLGDSTARKYGRRGVLAALGLATLGTGSASAQASGSVGTSSSPVDVFGYDVDASNSFTDPAGVQHTGELADISDVGASGQWQEVNSGANIEPIDGETIGTGSEDVDVGSVSTVEALIGDGTNPPLVNNGRTDPELLVQPSGGDEVGSVLTLPSGSANRAHFLVGNNSDRSNFGGVKWELEGDTADIQSFSKGTAAAPTQLYFRLWDSVVTDTALTTSDVPLGARKEIQRYGESSSNTDNLASEGIQFTDSVGTSAEVIYDAPEFANLCVVVVRPGGGDRLVELVLYMLGASPQVISTSQRGTVPGRTYTIGTNNELELALNSGSAVVGVKGVGISTGTP